MVGPSLHSDLWEVTLPRSTWWQEFSRPIQYILSFTMQQQSNGQTREDQASWNHQAINIHVAKDDSGKEGKHFPIMKFELDTKCIEAFEGVGSHYSWTTDATTILQGYCLIDESQTIEAAHWTICSTILIKHVDVVNCGPKACATLASLLLEEDAVFFAEPVWVFSSRERPKSLLQGSWSLP